MNNKTIGILVVVAVVVGGAAFWGGMTYAQSQTPARGQFAGGNFAGGGGAGNRGARGGGNGGGAFGTIIAKDGSSVTIQLGGPNATSTNGTASGSKIVLYNASTQVGKMVTGSVSDLTVGEMVSVQGSANADGSITAQMIQIRPAGTGGGFRGNAPGATTGQ